MEPAVVGQLLRSLGRDIRAIISRRIKAANVWLASGGMGMRRWLGALEAVNGAVARVHSAAGGP
eukprot:3605628-Alexandrium_andersonii.AAC.1